MLKHQLKKFNHDQIDNILEELDLSKNLRESEKWMSDLKTQESDLLIFNYLIEHEEMDAATQFLALGLPKREAIWWGYICALNIETNNNHLINQNALQLTNQWVKSPADELRKEAKAIADQLAQYTPASWCAMAVYWSGGSIAPSDQPNIEPNEWMCGQAVNNAILMAAQQHESPLPRLKQYHKQGLHIAMGGNGQIEQE